LCPRSETRLFAYPYTIDDLDNGLRPCRRFPPTFQIWWRFTSSFKQGLEKEVEPGKSGYAHLFEHIMFRGSENYTRTARPDHEKAGAESNGQYKQ
jgi:zinc protease